MPPIVGIDCIAEGEARSGTDFYDCLETTKAHLA